MTENLIVESLTGIVTDISNYENLFQETDKGEIRIFVLSKVPEDILKDIENDIINQGVVLLTPITQDANVVVIRFQKMMAPLLILGGAAALIVVAAGGFVGWQMFKLTPEQASMQFWGIIGLAVTYALFKYGSSKERVTK